MTSPPAIATTPPRRLWRAVCLAVITAALASCNNLPTAATDPATVPTDLAIELLIVGNPRSSDLRQQTARYMLEPNRRLRAAWGSDAMELTSPGTFCVITPAEQETLWRHIASHRLLDRAADPAADAAADAPSAGTTVTGARTVYALDFTVAGRPHSFARFAGADAEVDALVERIVAFRAARPNQTPIQTDHPSSPRPHKKPHA